MTSSLSSNPVETSTDLTETTTEAPEKKVRKAYTISKSRQSWTEGEHDKFLEALQLFDRDWKKIEDFVGSKTVIQIRSHAQKYFLKVEKNGTFAHVPPPRPKRKAAHPYPQKASKNAQMSLHVSMSFPPQINDVPGYPSWDDDTSALLSIAVSEVILPKDEIDTLFVIELNGSTSAVSPSASGIGSSSRTLSDSEGLRPVNQAPSMQGEVHCFAGGEDATASDCSIAGDIRLNRSWLSLRTKPNAFSSWPSSQSHHQQPPNNLPPSSSATSGSSALLSLLPPLPRAQALLQQTSILTSKLFDVSPNRALWLSAFRGSLPSFLSSFHSLPPPLEIPKPSSTNEILSQFNSLQTHLFEAVTDLQEILDLQDEEAKQKVAREVKSKDSSLLSFANKLKEAERLKLKDILAYAHKISYTTFAPPEFGAGQAPLRGALPPAPQDEQMRASELYTFADLDIGLPKTVENIEKKVEALIEPPPPESMMNLSAIQNLLPPNIAVPSGWKPGMPVELPKDWPMPPPG
ncbi:unnamed protein product [Brassica rapa subsp. narinosa]